MRTFYLLKSVNPETKELRGFVLREGSGSKSYHLSRADHATLYTTRSGAVNSMPFALAGLGIEIPKEFSKYTRQKFVRKHFEVVEVQAILLPKAGFLDKLL